MRRRQIREDVVRRVLLIAAMTMTLISGLSHAASTNDQLFAKAALRELHNLAVASTQSEQAAKDDDDIGCRDAYESMQKAAHDALVSMHYMSFAPIDAIDTVSSLLRLSHLVPNGCAWKLVTEAHTLSMTAGQAIMALRWDYAIGDGDWYMINASGDVEAKNPLRYAQSLKDQNYSWVSVRPKDVLFTVESNWKAEMASTEVDDPSIENSGNNLKAVEVGYRKNSDDNNTMVYFYRTKADALAAAQALKQQAENDAKAAASNATWRQKLASILYLLANSDAGFKLVYAVCMPSGKNAQGENTCNNNGSFDWSDNRAVPYRWYSDFQECDDARLKLETHPPVSVGTDGDFTTDCMPAPKPTRRAMKGYKMILTLSPPDPLHADNINEDLRDRGSQVATVFKTFKACYDAGNAAYPRVMKDLGANENGVLLSDKTKYIEVGETCVRVY